MKTYIGIDPGKSGAISFIRGNEKWSVKLSSTIADVAEVLWSIDRRHSFAIIERVSSSPQMGVKSSFTFGQSYGQLEGLLTAFKIPFERVTPQTWQKYMKCMTGGDKNVTKRRAQELFPDIKITHANADSLLIAEYARRIDS